jgi:hypothetical protein
MGHLAVGQYDGPILHRGMHWAVEDMFEWYVRQRIFVNYAVAVTLRNL